MIICKACGYDNPLGRVHCMQCGAKVDLSMIVTADQATGSKGEVVVKAGRATTGGLGIGRLIKRAISLAIFAVIVVGGLLIWQNTPVRDIQTDPMHALTTKGKFDTLTQAQEGGKALTISFDEAEINSYLSDARSPHHIQFQTNAPSAGFPPKLIKYQIEIGSGHFVAVGVAQMHIGGYTNEFTVRSVGEFPDAGDTKHVKWTKTFVGRLPLHALPGGDWLAGTFSDSCFNLPDYEAEWTVLKGARSITLTPGKAIVSIGPAAH